MAITNELRLSAFAKHWENLAQKAIHEQWLLQDSLVKLCEQEMAERYHKRVIRLAREAKLPPAKSLSSFSYSDVKSIQKIQVDYLIQDRQRFSYSCHF